MFPGMSDDDVPADDFDFTNMIDDDGREPQHDSSSPPEFAARRRRAQSRRISDDDDERGVPPPPAQPKRKPAAEEDEDKKEPSAQGAAKRPRATKVAREPRTYAEAMEMQKKLCAELFKQAEKQWKRSIKLLGVRYCHLLKNNRRAGLYAHHDQPLLSCIGEHVVRWKKVSEQSRATTKELLDSQTREGLTLTQITLLAFLLKCRFFKRGFEDVLQWVKECEVCSTTKPELNIWPEKIATVFKHRFAMTRCIQAPELAHVFSVSVRALCEFEQRGKCDNKETIKVLAKLKNWQHNDIWPRQMWRNISIGGLDPVLLCGENRDRLYKVRCFKNFENDEFADLVALVTTIQLTFRVVEALSAGNRAAGVTEFDLRTKFSALKYHGILTVNQDFNSLVRMFEYPVTFESSDREFPEDARHEKQFYVTCRLSMGDGAMNVFPTLELGVLRYLFKAQWKQILQDLQYFIIDAPSSILARFADTPRPRDLGVMFPCVARFCADE